MKPSLYFICQIKDMNWTNWTVLYCIIHIILTILYLLYAIFSWLMSAVLINEYLIQQNANRLLHIRNKIQQQVVTLIFCSVSVLMRMATVTMSSVSVPLPTLPLSREQIPSSDMPIVGWRCSRPPWLLERNSTDVGTTSFSIWPTKQYQT